MRFQNLSNQQTPDPESPQANLNIKFHSRAPSENQPTIENPDYDEKQLMREEAHESPKHKVIIKFVIFIICLSFLIAGKAMVPLNQPDCVVDKLQNLVLGITNWILANPPIRDGLQILCSAMMDVMFLATAGHWVLRGTSSRLFVSVIGFYAVRALVQAMWWSPFPDKFWWYDPGFPSIVVPYGKGSDFFFSGHIGFVAICGLEWLENGYTKVAKVLALVGVYTAAILLIYQVHYSIDLFTGAFFAHYWFIMVNKNKEKIDKAFLMFYYSAKAKVTTMHRCVMDGKHQLM